MLVFWRIESSAGSRSMIEVTQEDMRWRKSFHRVTGYVDMDLSLAKLIARHRIAAENAALERAAKVAEKWIEPVMATPHENATYRSIATAIRALKGPSNG